MWGKRKERWETKNCQVKHEKVELFITRINVEEMI